MSGFTVSHTLIYENHEKVNSYMLDDVVFVDGHMHIVTKIDRGENVVYLTDYVTYQQEKRRGGLFLIEDDHGEIDFP